MPFPLKSQEVRFALSEGVTLSGGPETDPVPVKPWLGGISVTG